jgi:hypothetical protein
VRLPAIVFPKGILYTQEKIMKRLAVGQEVWGYIESSVTVMGTEYQAYGSVTRLDDGRYKASVGGRHDGTGFEDYYPTQQQAMAAAHLPLDGEFLEHGTNFRIKTVFDLTAIA